MYPFINFFGMIIPSYGLCLCLSVLLCGLLYIKRGLKLGLEFEDMIIIAAVSLASGLFFGGAMYIAVTYSPQEIYNYIKKTDFSFVLNGGLVFYGGLTGGIIGACLSCKILKIETKLIEMSAVPVIPLGHAIGRIGCLMAGCCGGFEYSGIFAFKSLLDDKTYFPVQLVEAVLNLMIMASLLLYLRKRKLRYYPLYYYLIMYSVMRFCVEFLRGDEIRGSFAVLSTSQWYSIFVFIGCIVWKSCILNSEKGKIFACRRNL